MTVPRSTRSAVLGLAREHPEMGKVRAARELRNRGVLLSPSAVHAIWKLHGLASTYERLMLRRRNGRGEKAELSDSQRALLRRTRLSRRLIAKAPHLSKQLRRERLLLAAARVLAEKGYEKASLREICAGAGILPGSLYYHFRSKEDLFVTLHSEAFRQLNEAVDTASARVIDPWAKLEAACAAHLTLLVGEEDVSLVGGTSLFHLARPALQRRLNRDRDAYEERYRRMIAALELPPEVDQSLLRLNLLGALNWTHHWYRPGRKTPQQLAYHLVHKILRGSLEARSRQSARKVALS